MAVVVVGTACVMIRGLVPLVQLVCKDRLGSEGRRGERRIEERRGENRRGCKRGER